MEKEYDVNDYPLFNEMYNRVEPYHYFELYLQGTKHFLNDPITSLRILSKNPQELITQRNFVRISDLGFNHHECKIIQIDKDLLPLLEDTEPEYSELHMPLPAMFINQQFNIGRYRINGFLLFDIQSFRKMGYQIEDDTNCSIRILSVCLNTESKYEFYSVEPLMKYDDSSPLRYTFGDSDAEIKEMKKAAKLISRLGANLINTLIYNPDEIEQVPVNYTREQNLKRIARGKRPHRDKLVFRLSGRLKQYAQHYGALRGEISVRFLVWGHWMVFRHERYKNVKGTRRWIWPFYKGQEKADELYHRFIEVKA
jgi:hypothetical protein